MAAGAITVFNAAKLAILNGIHDLDTDVLKLAFLGGATATPTAAALSPTLASYTAVNGGSFPVIPATMAVTAMATGSTITFAITSNISYAKNAANPTSVKWALLYNSSKMNQAIAFVEVDTVGFNATGGAFALTWGVNVFTLT